MTKVITSKEIAEWDKYYRINLLNKLSGFKSACLIGTCDKDGNTNLAVFNSVMHIGADPFYIGFILRPNTVERHTYENIKATNYYTINHITTSIYQQSHQTSAKYERGVSEFEMCNLSEAYIDGFKAPFVEESVVKLGLSFAEEQLIRSNQTRLIIGKVEKIILPEDSIDPNGDIRLDLLDSIVINGLNTYFKANYLEKLDFARPQPKIEENS